jgi:HAD superfamily hydrolase (TIGR01662 family)
MKSELQHGFVTRIDTPANSPYHFIKQHLSLGYYLHTDQLSCVIFDMDGTLTQTNELIFASFNHVTQRYLGKSFSPMEIVAFFGPPEEGAIEKLLGAEYVNEAMVELCRFYRAKHGEMARLHPGIDDVLKFLKQRGIKLAVFTGKGRRTATITLEEFKLSAFFDVVVSGNDVTCHKPHPEGIQKIMKQFSLLPHQVLMVGDSMSDVKASHGAGVKIAAVLWDSFDRERVLAAQTDYVFHNVSEMLDWFCLHMN